MSHSSTYRYGIVSFLYIVALLFLTYMSKSTIVTFGIMLWYAPAGLNLSLLLIFGLRYAPAIVLAVFLGGKLILFPEAPLVPLLLVAVSCAAIESVTVILIQRTIGLDWKLWSVREFGLFLSVIIAMPILVAATGVIFYSSWGLIPWYNFYSIWFNWWIGDLIGILSVMPVMVFTLTDQFHPLIECLRSSFGSLSDLGSWLSQNRAATYNLTAQMISIPLVLFLSTMTSFATDFDAFYLFFLPVLWIAFQHGLQGATLAVMGMNIGVTFFFDLSAEVQDQVNLQFFMVMLSLTGLFVGKLITDRNAFENEVLRQKRLFETMFDAIRDGVVITDTQNGVVLANKGVLGTFGYIPEELIGKTITRLHAENRHEAGRRDPGAKSVDTITIKRFHRKDGSAFSGELFESALYDGGNQWIGNLCIIRDVTERENAECQVRQAQKMEALGTLSGGIAHDFNNILFPIMGYTEMMLCEISDDSELRSFLEQIYAASVRAKDLVAQILTFSRQTRGALDKIQIQLIVKEVLKLLRHTIPTTIEIQHNISTHCPPVYGDPTQIHQIIMNLTTNAYHAMEERGGVLTVSLKAVDLSPFDGFDPQMTPGRYACLSVEDTGVGIPESIRQKIFDPFFTTKCEGKGTGMGLSVVHGIVKDAGGKIEVQSEMGKGTIFQVYLPVAETHGGVEKDPDDSVIKYGSERILLVDDERSVLEMVQMMLKKIGYHVTSQTSSIEALALFQSHPDQFDLVISDLQMPKMAGDRLAEALLSIRSDIPILICTGFSENISEESLLGIGIRELLMKPVDMGQLSCKVREVLDDDKIDEKSDA